MRKFYPRGTPVTWIDTHPDYSDQTMEYTGVVMGGPTDLGGSAYPNGLLVYTVKYEGCYGKKNSLGRRPTSTLVHASKLKGDGVPNVTRSWREEPHHDICPSCEEEYYFLEDDYICAECRLA